MMFLQNNNRLSKLITVTCLLSGLIIVMSFAISNTNNNGDPGKNKKPAKDSIASVKAFGEVYKVLMSPRCMNCHPAGDVPLQGDDSHIHTMNPQRGKDGHGVYAMKCGNCHQPENTPGLNTPPGNP